MEKKSKKFIVIFLMIMIFSVIFSYYNYVVKRNYRIFYNENEIPAQTDIMSIIKP